MKKGKLIIISGPSGAGKGTIIDKLLDGGDFVLSRSCTTRRPRGSEQDGVEYFFVTAEKFREMIEQDAFLEYADVFGKMYGTPKENVLNLLNRGKNVLLEIDVQGAAKVKKNYPDALTIFILPPSEEVLLERLKNRGTETEEQVNKRFQKAKEEMACADNYDCVVVNNDLEAAVSAVKEILAHA